VPFRNDAGSLDHRSGLRAAPATPDHRVLVLARAISDLHSAGQVLDIIHKRHSFEALLSRTQLELPHLSQALQEVAIDSRKCLAHACHGRDLSSGPVVDDILERVFDRVLSGKSRTALTNMLRLWQVMETYCRTVVGSEGSRLYEAGAAYRTICVSLLRDFEEVGLSFHPVRFLEMPPDSADWQYQLSYYPPVLQNNDMLTGPCIARLGDFNGLVADVSLWGADCRINPDLSSQTNLSCWWR